MKRPAFQFYPADWRKDLELQSCSIGARGLWWELSCLMHEADPYGHLTLNGVAMPDDKTARAVRVELREYKRLLAEIEGAGVSSRTDAGVLFSRRMVRDEQIRNARAAGGHDGAEHGAKGGQHGKKGGRPKSLKGAEITPLRGVNGTPLNPPPSSSSSSSASTIGGTSSLLSGSKPDDTPLEKKAERTRKLRADAVGVLTFLNEASGSAYQPVAANVDLIVARLKEGFTPKQCRQVVANRAREWKGDQKMDDYLRPKTLFNATNFANYAGKIVPVPDDEEARAQ